MKSHLNLQEGHLTVWGGGRHWVEKEGNRKSQYGIGPTYSDQTVHYIGVFKDIFNVEFIIEV